MTEVTESIGLPKTLTQAQADVAEMLQSCERAAASARATVQRLRDDVRVLEEVLPVKRTALERAQQDYDETRAILRETFTLYRDMLGLDRSGG